MSIFTEIDKRTQREHVVVSRHWPDGVRFRRRCPNKTVANNLLARINGAIAIGTWVELRRTLTERPAPIQSTPVQKDLTVKEFAKVYLSEYCQTRNSRPDFKEETLETIVRILGPVRLSEFNRSHAHVFEATRSAEHAKTGKKGKLSAATVNRGLAVLSNMLTHAVRTGRLTAHPMTLYGRLKEKQNARRYLTLEEERRLVGAVYDHDPVVGSFAGILGETGMRLEEGLRLKWDHVDIQNRILTVAASKTVNIRHVPLSDFAIELLRGLTRFVNHPEVFVRLSTMRPLKAPRKEFSEGKKSSGLTWVRGFRDLRHFRASQWVRGGVDLVTVQGLLGHESIETTMIYAHFDPGHASTKIIEVQRRESAAGNG